MEKVAKKITPGYINQSQNSAHSYTEGSEISFDVPETLNTKKPCRYHEPGKQCDIFIGKEFCSTQPCEQ